MLEKQRVMLICDGVKNAPDTLQGGYTVRELQMYRAACDRIAVEVEKLSVGSEGMPEPQNYECPVCGNEEIELGQGYCQICGEPLDWTED